MILAHIKMKDIKNTAYLSYDLHHRFHIWFSSVSWHLETWKKNDCVFFFGNSTSHTVALKLTYYTKHNEKHNQNKGHKKMCLKKSPEENRERNHKTFSHVVVFYCPPPSVLFSPVIAKKILHKIHLQT